MEWFLDLVDGISLEPVALSLELAFVTTCILPVSYTHLTLPTILRV